jgi:uncharacterized membrane protein
MKKFVFFFAVLLAVAGLAIAQESGTRMQQIMKGDDSGMQEEGMGMMGMMKMMEQCKDMMKLGQAKSGAQESPESALDILKKCYARGEISRQEFEAMKKKFNSNAET